MRYEKELMILVGPIGSGKTTFAKTLENDASIRISQDEMGRKAYLKYFQEAITEGVPRVIVDRMNFNKEQRERFIKPAREAGYCVTIFEIDHNPGLCIDRVVQRKDHPTIPKGSLDLAKKILLNYYKDYEHPDPDEFDNYNLVPMEK